MFQRLKPGLRWVLSGLTYSGLGLSFCGPLATASSKLHPHAELLKDAPNSRLTITRYSGHPDFNSMQSLAWMLGSDGRYYAGNRIYSRIQIGSNGPCESFLADQQKFSLKKMISTHYLQKSDLPKYLRLGESFETGQVNFVMRSRDLSRKTAMEIASEDYDERINHLIEEHETGKVPFITATMWSVSGQMLEPSSGKDLIVDLPWQKDPERKSLAEQFRRQRKAGKYKFVVEWGRTAQDLPQEAEPLGSALSSINYNELIAMKGKLDDAYIMFHSFDKVNTRAYSLRFPGCLYPEGWQNKDDALFLVPLSKVLKEFPPSRFSGKMNRIVENSRGKLDEVGAMDLLAQFNRVQFTLLDVVGKNRQFLPRPLAVRDVSYGAAARRVQLFNHLNLTSLMDNDGFAESLMTLQGVLPNWNSGQYTDLSDMAVSVFNMQENNAVEISNLDRAAAVFDQDYIKRMLLSVFCWYMKSFSYDRALTQEMADEIAGGMAHYKVKFGLTTFDEVLMKKIRALKPASEFSYKDHYVSDPSVSDPLSAMPGQEWLARGYVDPPVTFYFTAEQLLKLSHDNLELFKRVQNDAGEGVWMRQLMLSNPDIF